MKEFINLKDTEERLDELCGKMPNRYLKSSNLVAILVIVGIFGLSILIKYPSTIDGTAVLTTNLPPEIIIVSTSGQVEKVFAEDGQVVMRDAPILVMRSAASYDDVLSLKNVLLQLRISQNELFDLEGIVDYDMIIDKCKNLELGSLHLEVNNLSEAYKNYKHTVDGNLENIKTYFIHKNQEQISTRFLELKGDTADLQTELEIALRNQEKYENLYTQGTISRLEFEKAQNRIFAIEKQKTENLIAITEVYDELENSKLDNNVTHLTRSMTAQQQIHNIVNKLDELDAAIYEWEIANIIFSRTEGRAHFKLPLFKNMQLEKGTEIVLIENPEAREFIVSTVAVPSKGYGKISIGNRVYIYLDEFPETEFGYLEGEVTHLPDVSNSEGEYVITTSFKNNLLSSQGKQISFKPFLTGTARVLVDNKSFFSRVIKSDSRD